MKFPLLVVGILLLVGATTLAAFRFLRSGVLPGITVDGKNVGALDGPALQDKLEDLRFERGGRAVTVTRLGADGGEVVSASTRADMGFDMNVDATSQRVLQRGRQGDPLAALADHLRATFGGFDVTPVADTDDDTFEGWLEVTTAELTDPAFPGGIEFEGLEVRGVAPSQGLAIDPEELRSLALSEVRPGTTHRLDLAAVVVEPDTDQSDLDKVVEQAERAVSGPLTLTHGEERLVLNPSDLALILGAAGTDDGRLVLRADRKALKGLVDEPERFSSAPIDATFEPDGDGVRIVPSKPGFGFSARKAAKQIPKVALSEDRRARLKGKDVEAEFTKSEAEKLGITEQVSTFTTHHSCCEPRVANIHRIADLLDGAIVEPGETFSLNDFVGPRTAAKGFVPAPSIRDGEFVAEVGGGISQFATTFFNAIFFGGYDFLEYKAHSYYISRYPRGREATISTPTPDLAFSNDSDHGIFIDTSYTDTSITVSFFGTSQYEIEAVMGEPFNTRPPPEECKVNKDLGKNESRVVQSGLTGFDVVVKRVFRPGGRVEPFTTHYLAQARITERKRCPSKSEN